MGYLKKRFRDIEYKLGVQTTGVNGILRPKITEGDTDTQAPLKAPHIGKCLRLWYDFLSFWGVSNP